MLLWEEKIKYQDKSESVRQDSGKSSNLRANKPGKVELKSKTANSYLSMPIERNAELITTDGVHNGIEYTKVEVTRPHHVYYILSDTKLIKAVDPKNTTFEGEYYGN